MNIHQLVQYIDAKSEKTNTPTYTFLGNPEEEDTVLSKQLDLCFGNEYWGWGTSSRESVHVYVCMYRRVQMNVPVCSKISGLRSETTDKQSDRTLVGKPELRETLPVEYLAYWMEKPDGKNTYTFPSFAYQCPEDDSTDETNSTGENAFKTACIDHIVSVRSLEQKGLAKHTYFPTSLPSPHFEGSLRGPANFDSRAEFDIGYKGFVADKNKAFVFFDSEKFESVFSPKQTSDLTSTSYRKNDACLWAVVDEIVNKRSVLGVDVDPVVVRLFQQNPILWNIQVDGHNIDYPRQMYALIPTDVAHEFDPTEMDLETETYPATGKTLLHMSMALSYSYSDLFSDRYLFTKEPLPGNADTSRISKRYACFVYNPRTVLDPTVRSHRACIKKYPNNTIENIRLEAEDDDEVAEQLREIPCVVFVDKLKHHRRTTMWGFLQPNAFDEIL